MPIVNIVLGLILLLLGRRLFWAFVAVAGFLVAMQYANAAFADQTEAVRILIALGAGILGAIIAVVLNRFGFAIGGLYAGGYLALSIANAAGSNDNLWVWFAIGGAIGAIAAALLMDWAIIALSALVGAGAIADAAGLAPLVSLILFVALALVGMLVQGKQLVRTPKPGEQ